MILNIVHLFFFFFLTHQLCCLLSINNEMKWNLHPLNPKEQTHLATSEKNLLAIIYLFIGIYNQQSYINSPNSSREGITIVETRCCHKSKWLSQSVCTCES